MTKAITTKADADVLAQLNESYPVETGFQRIQLPRLGLFTQDKWEGKGKSAKVIQEAGTFYTELETDEVDENDKKIWKKSELGKTIEGIIVFQRKQLRMFDQATEAFTSSPVYDEDIDILKLWCNKEQVGEGTPAELKKLYETKDDDGKVRSKLKEEKILYVLYEGEIYQLTVRGSALYMPQGFFAYRKTFAGNSSPRTVVTEFGSVGREKGSTVWNQMTFKKVREINAEEANLVVQKLDEIQKGVALERAFFKRSNAAEVKANEDFKQLT